MRCALQSLLPADIVPPGGLHIDFRLVVFAVATAILSTVLFGLFPAILAATTDLNSALKEDGRTLTGSAKVNRSRKILLVTQVALAAILLIGAGLMLHSLDRVLSAPEGFRPDHVLVLNFHFRKRSTARPETGIALRPKCWSVSARWREFVRLGSPPGCLEPRRKPPRDRD